jgi:hypothetical protein
MRHRGLARAAFVVLAGGLIYGTWRLPYRFPQQGFVIGASNEVGFNNTVSFAAYLVCVPLLALLASRWLDRPSPSAPPPESGRIAATVAAAIGIGHLLLFAALYAYKGRFVFAEGLYFQSLLYRMSAGELPYRDFGFYYGPLMIYPAYWLSRFMSLDLAYGVWFVTTYLTGLVFLYVVLRACLPSDRTRAVWFAFLSLGLFNPLTGLNETFTRYLFPTVVFLSAAGCFERGGIARGALAGVLLAAGVSYSSEVAALSIGAVAVLAGLLALRSRTPWRTDVGGPVSTRVSAGRILTRACAVGLGGGACSVAFFLAADPTGGALRDYPAVAASYSGGAHNVPIYPHLPFLALAAITVAALAELWRALRENPGSTPMVTAAGYAVVALAAQRAAFGAAEPSHFAYFGLPIVCLALLLTTRIRDGRRARAWLAGLLTVGIVLPMQYYHVMEFAPFVARRLNVLPGVNASDGLDPAGQVSTLDQALRDVVQTVGIGHPYVMYEMEYASLPVYRDFGLRYGTYFTMLITARDEQGMRRAIDEVRASRAIVVVRKQDLDGLERPRQSSGFTRLFDTLSGAHTAGSDLNALLLRSRTRLTAPFLKFVQTEYRPLYDRDGLVAFGPIETGAP